MRADSPITVTALNIYPIKSCQGIALTSVEVGPRGPLGDRQWMVVRPDGTFLTQRTHAAMAHIRTAFAGGRLTVSADGMPDLPVPAVGEAVDGAISLQARVWKDTVACVSMGGAVDAWFTQKLGTPCHLVAIAPGAARRRVRDIYPAGYEVNFPDSGSFLLTSEASLADLNSRLATPVPMERFRPNIVIGGNLPYEEDQWPALAIGPISFPAAWACERCVITTMDQRTGARTAEPLATLARYRKEGTGILFGQRLIHRGTGTLAVGDQVLPSVLS